MAYADRHHLLLGERCLCTSLEVSVHQALRLVIYQHRCQHQTVLAQTKKAPFSLIEGMPFYKLRRHVIYWSGNQETMEVWGIDRVPAALPTAGAPPSTDADDPLGGGPCSPLLLMRDGDYVTWHRFTEWLSEAEEAGYELISGFKNLSPYSQMVLRGP